MKMTEGPVYIAFYKPYGVLSQFTPEAGHKSLGEFGFPKNVYPVGRLDHDSEGLLLLSNDKTLTKRLLDPLNAHPRTYLAQVEGVPTKQALELLRRGVRVQNYRTKPCKASVLEHEPALEPRTPPIRYRKNIPAAWMKLILTEGKNRQVRRMTAAVGFPTLRLVRVAINAFPLDPLKPGQWRFIDKTDIFSGDSR